MRGFFNSFEIKLHNEFQTVNVFMYLEREADVFAWVLGKLVEYQAMFRRQTNDDVGLDFQPHISILVRIWWGS
jgi:hypothetical protein